MNNTHNKVPTYMHLSQQTTQRKHHKTHPNENLTTITTHNNTEHNTKQIKPQTLLNTQPKPKQQRNKPRNPHHINTITQSHTTSQIKLNNTPRLIERQRQRHNHTQTQTTHTSHNITHAHTHSNMNNKTDTNHKHTSKQQNIE